MRILKKNLRLLLEEVFDAHQIFLDERSSVILEKISPLLRHLGEEIISEEKIIEIESSLAICVRIKDKKEFIDNAFEILKPLIESSEKISCGI